MFNIDLQEQLHLEMKAEHVQSEELSLWMLWTGIRAVFSFLYDCP